MCFDLWYIIDEIKDNNFDIVGYWMLSAVDC